MSHNNIGIKFSYFQPKNGLANTSIKDAAEDKMSLVSRASVTSKKSVQQEQSAWQPLVKVIQKVHACFHSGFYLVRFRLSFLCLLDL